MSPPTVDWSILRRVAWLLALCAFSLYLPTIFHGFFADDDIYLSFGNRLLRDTGWGDFYRLFLERANPWEYLPLRDLTYWLDFRIYGTEGAGFHVTNLIWYGLSAIAAGYLFRELIVLFRPEWRTRAIPLALSGVAVFLVHPAHVEAVAWVASRKDLVAGALSLFSAFVLTRAIRRNWSLPSVILAALLLLFAAFAKAAALTIAIFQVALVLANWHRSPEVPCWKKVVAGVLFVQVAMLAAVVHMQMGEATGIRIDNTPGGFLVIERASRIAATLVGLLFWPKSLGLYHDVYSLGEWHWVVSATVLGAVLVAVAILSSRRALWQVGVLLAVSPLLLYLQFVPFSTWSMASERFLFVSVAGAALMLIDALGRFSPRTGIILVSAIFLPCALQAWHRVGEWEYPSTLRTIEYERQPDFHNVTRDRILHTLLPEKRYDEAERLSQTVARPYAAEALSGMVRLARIHETLGYWRRFSEETGPEIRMLCSELDSFRKALTAGYASIRTEPDLSYNNLLRSLERRADFVFADSESACRARVY